MTEVTLAVLLVLWLLTFAIGAFMSGKLVMAIVLVALASGIAGLANSLY